jgi:hypothetical protein
MRAPVRSGLLVPVLATLALTAACSHNTYSPPASTLPMGTASTLGQDRTSVSGGVSSLSEMLGVDLQAGYVQLSRGVDDRTDVSIRGSRAEVNERSVKGTSPVAVAGRLGFKHNPGITQRNFAVFGGAGMGRSAAGRFVSGDVGVAVSIENCYLVPTFAARVFASKHIDPRPVDVTTDPDEPRVDTPRPTAGYDAGFALELPMGGCGTRAPFAIRANAGMMKLDDGETQLELAHGTIGAIYRF